MKILPKKIIVTLGMILLPLTLIQCNTIKETEIIPPFNVEIPSDNAPYTHFEGVTIRPKQLIIPTADLEFAKSQFNTGHYEMAEYYLKKTLINLPDDATALKLLPWAYFYQKRYDKALLAFGHANSRFPKDPEALMGLGWSYFGLLNYEKALEHFEKAGQFLPNSFHVRKGMGFTFLKLYQPVRAREEFLKIYTELEIEQVMELWDQWQGDDLETILDIIPISINVPTLLTLPVESPRYQSVMPGQPAVGNRSQLEDGWRYFRNKYYDKAHKIFYNLSRGQSNGLDAWNGLAWTYLRMGQLKKADEEFQSILHKHPRFIGALEGAREVEYEKMKKAAHAKNYFSIGKYTIAQSKFDELSKEFPRWPYAHAQLGYVNLQTNDYEKARSNFKKALELDPVNETAISGLEAVQKTTYPELYHAEQAYKKGDYKTSARAYSDYLDEIGEASPNSEIIRNAYNGLGWSLYYKKQYAMAINKFEKNLDHTELRFESAKGLGLSYFQLANYRKAAEYLQLADNLQHNNREIVPLLDWSILRSMQSEKSEDYFKEALMNNPLRYSAYLGLGWINYKNNKPDLGVEYFLKAISLDPDFALTNEFANMMDQEKFGWQIYNRLGWAYYHRQRYARALELFRESLDRQAGKSETLKGIGYSLYRLGSYSQAITFLQQCLAENSMPKPIVEIVMNDKAITPFRIKTSVLTTIGRSYLALGKYQEAVLSFNQELRQHPEWPEIYDGLGWSLLGLNRLTEARVAFDQAIRHQPLFYSAHKGMSELKQKSIQGKLESATQSIFADEATKNPVTQAKP
jgi:tetratricopeptide (TPR) repeat protein